MCQPHYGSKTRLKSVKCTPGQLASSWISTVCFSSSFCRGFQMCLNHFANVNHPGVGVVGCDLWYVQHSCHFSQVIDISIVCVLTESGSFVHSAMSSSHLEIWGEPSCKLFGWVYAGEICISNRCWLEKIIVSRLCLIRLHSNCPTIMVFSQLAMLTA